MPTRWLIRTLEGNVVVRWTASQEARSAAREARAVSVSNKQLIDCVTAWANATADRSERVSGINNDNTQATRDYILALGRALDDVIRKDPAALAKDLPKYQQEFRDFKAAAARLQRTLAANPVPASPRFACQ